jgi:hypothetical protein
MARKPATANTAEETAPTMDYAQHNATYHGFLAMVKWSIVGSLITAVALYCFIEAHQPVLGTILLLILPVGGVALAITRARSST